MGGQATGHRVLTLQRGYTPKIKSHTHRDRHAHTHSLTLILMEGDNLLKWQIITSQTTGPPTSPLNPLSHTFLSMTDSRLYFYRNSVREKFFLFVFFFCWSGRRRALNLKGLCLFSTMSVDHLWSSGAAAAADRLPLLGPRANMSPSSIL